MENLSVIGTKCLNKQRLFLLMHEPRLVYILSLEPVGEEASRHHGKAGNCKQVKKVAIALMQMSIAMGLEPAGKLSKRRRTLSGVRQYCICGIRWVKVRYDLHGVWDDGFCFGSWRL